MVKVKNPIPRTLARPTRRLTREENQSVTVFTRGYQKFTCMHLSICVPP